MHTSEYFSGHSSVPIELSESLEDYLESEEIACLEFQAYPSELNPTENFVNVIGLAVHKSFTPPATVTQLETALREEW